MVAVLGFQQPSVNPGTPDTVKQLREEAARDLDQAAREENEATQYRELAKEQRREAAKRRDPLDKKIAIDIAERREREAKELEDEAQRLRERAKSKEARADALEAILRMSSSPDAHPTSSPITGSPNQPATPDGASSSSASGPTTPITGSVTVVSAKGMIRLVTPKKFVPGEFFEVAVNVPSSGENSPKDGHLGWALPSNSSLQQKEASIYDLPGEVPATVGFNGGGTVKVTAPFKKVAPTGKDQRFELRLFSQKGWDVKLLDTLEVIVRIDEVDGALQLAKTSFTPGEPIEFTVNLPANRYYYGDWQGPIVMLYPLEINGSAKSDQEAHAWSEKYSGLPSGLHASYVRPLLSIVQGTGKNLYGGSYEIVPGTYHIKKDLDPRKFGPPLFAPPEPGRYELRLYDRGFNFPFGEYVDSYFARRVITVAQNMETIQVRVDGTDATTKTVLKRGVEYRIEVSGTALVGGPAGGVGDAEYFGFSGARGPLNSCALSPKESLDVGLAFDYGGSAVTKSPNWGGYNPEHLYKTFVVGVGEPLKLKYHDCDYRDNSGLLTVNIVETKSASRQ
jgi:hypothetical protein